MDREDIISVYLEKEDVRRLHLGSSNNFMKGWLNSDLMPHNGFDSNANAYIYLNATKPFPLEDNTFDYVFSEHMIEHISYPEGGMMLQECYRVLRPGGKIRIATPDLEVILGLYSSAKTPEQKEYIAWITDRFLPNIDEYNEVFVINNAFRNWGHKFIYNREVLKDLLERTGFKEIKTYSVGESEDANLMNLEAHGRRMKNEPMNKFETMVLEAVAY